MARRTPPQRSRRRALAAEPIIVQVDEIVLDNVKVRVTNEDLPLDTIQLDPANPRVAYTVRLGNFGSGKTLQTALENLLWKDEDVRKQLYDGIFANGGLIERIIVRNNGVVAEGNCRTLVYRKLRAEHPTDPRWKNIPARVLPSNITEKQVAKLLGEMHIGGKNEWSAFEKSAHIHKLYTEFTLTQEEIAKLLRTSKTAVNHNIRAFTAMSAYLEKFGSEGAVRKFSYFFELFKIPELRLWATNRPDAVSQFSTWVGKGKIARGVDVRELKDIVSNPRALAAFEEDGREAAMKVIEADKPELSSPLLKSMADLTQALESATLDDIQRVRKDVNGAARRVVRRVKESLDRFVDLCGGVD